MRLHNLKAKKQRCKAKTVCAGFDAVAILPFADILMANLRFLYEMCKVRTKF